MLITFLLLVAAAVAGYVWLLRPLLRQRREFAPLFARLDAARAGRLARLRLALKGLKTRLAARAYILAGALVATHDALLPLVEASGLDWKPLVPPAALPWLLIGTGLLFGWLRRLTTTPEGQKG